MSKVKEYPSKKDLRRKYTYSNGNLLHNFNYAKAKIGQVAGYLKPDTGYIVIGIKGRLYKAHRLIWIYHYGENPEHDIDHIDKDKTNNKIENLRVLTRSQNLHNAKTRKDKVNGCVGVSWVKAKGYFQATICIDYKQTYLGGGSLFEACCLRKGAELKHYTH